MPTTQRAGIAGIPMKPRMKLYEIKIYSSFVVESSWRKGKLSSSFSNNFIMEKLLQFSAVNSSIRHFSHYQTGMCLDMPILGKPLIRIKMDESDQGATMKLGISYMHFIRDKFEIEYRPSKTFHELRAEMTDIGNGIFKKTLKEGYGEIVKENTQISVHYTIIMENKEIFSDSTYLAQKPYSYVLGKTQDILPNFEKALRTMRNQEKAAFIVPRLLYAEDEEPPTEEELKDGYLMIEVIRVTEVLTRKEKVCLQNNFTQTLQHVQKLRNQGKAAFLANFYHVAASNYLDAVYLLRDILIRCEEENNTRFDLLVKMCVNAGIVLNKINQPELANKLLKYAVGFVENCVNMTNSFMGKIYFHASRSYRLLHQHEMAFVHIKRAQDFMGDVQIIKDEFKSLCQSYDEQTMKIFFMGSFIKSSKLTYEDIPCPEGETRETIFGDTFNHMMETFVNSQDEMWTVYGVHGAEYISEARMVVNKYDQVDLDVFENDLGCICYILIRK